MATAESEHGTAYGAIFRTLHPHDFHVIAGVGLSAREAEFWAVLRALTIVPHDLTLYVVCTSQCQIDLHIRLHAWAKDNKGCQQRDGTPILGKGTLVAIYEHLEGRATQVYWRPWGTSAVNRRYQELQELLQIGLRLARPPDHPLPPERQVLQRPPGSDSQDRPAIQEGMASVLRESTIYSVTQPLSPLTLPSSGDEALPPPSPVYSNAWTLTPQPPSRS